MEKIIEQVITKRTYTRQVRQLEHTCPICRAHFWGGPLARYCGESCRNRASYVKHAEQRKAERRQRYQRRKEAFD